MAERWTPAQIKAKIKEVAEAEGVPYELALGVATQESYLDPEAVGDGGRAKGLFQLHPGAAVDVGINPLMRHIPALNITGGVKYLKQKLQQAGGDEDKALALYNGGGDPNYVQNVRGMMAKERGGGTAKARAGPAQDKGFTYTQADVQNFLREVNQGESAQGERGLPGNYEPGTIDPEKGLVINIEKGPGLGIEARPAAMVQLTPDMDDDEILQRLGYDPAEVKKSKVYRPGMFKENVPTADEAAGLDNPIGGIAYGVGDLAYGGVQLGSRALHKVGLRELEDITLYDALRKQNEAIYQQNIRKGRKVDPETGEVGVFSDPARLVGQALPTLPFGGAGATQGVLRTFGRNALMGGLTAALQPVETGQPGSPEDTYWAQKTRQTATGVLLGGGMGTALEKGVVPLAAKAIQSRLGSRAVGGGPAQRMADIAERHRIRTSYGDVSQNRGVQTVENVLTAIPGTGATAMRLGQQADVFQEAPRVVDRALDVMRRTGWRNLRQVRTAATRGGPRGEDARIILDEIANAGDDWGRIIQASGKLSLFQDRLRATQLYDRVERLAQPLGNMRPNRTIAAIDLALDDVNDQVALAPEVRRQVQQNLQRIRDEITPQGQSQAVPPMRNSITGTPVPQQPILSTHLPDTTYSRMRKLDSHLGGVKRDAVDPTTAHYLGQVRSALRQDMDDFAQHSGIPELTQAHREAKRFYRERVVKYREGQLANAIKRDMPDEIYQRFVKQGADRARYFYEGLDPKGRAAVRYGMIEEAFQDATKKDPGIFHPGRFAESMQKIQDARGVFFHGRSQQAREVNDFTNLMRHIKAAGDIAERGAQGQRVLTSIALGGGGYFNPLFVAKVMGTGQGLRALFMTERGRRFLMTSGRLEPGSPAWLREANRFARSVSSGTGALAGRAQRGTTPEPGEE